MSRMARIAPGGLVYHVLNRSVGRMHMFRKEADFEAFERVIVETHEREPIRILSYCVLSNHWHFVAWREEGRLIDGLFPAARAHPAMRWRVSHRTVGYRHLYQGRFKSFPVQDDDHLLGLLRYVERNPVLRASRRSSTTVAMGQPVVEDARRASDQGVVIALAGWKAGQLDGTRQHALDRNRATVSSGEHCERTTLRRGRLGEPNGKERLVWSEQFVQKAGHEKRANP